MRPRRWSACLRSAAAAVVVALASAGIAQAAVVAPARPDPTAGTGAVASWSSGVRATTSTAPSTASSASARVRRVRLRAAVSDLPVAGETRAGYAREKFRDWYDADGDCRDTRDEVLAQESRVAVAGCDISTGRWFSYYDGRTWTSDDDVDIDHLVPLAEVWDSGAKRWTGGTRDRYANDLGDRRTLAAVTDSVNQSKGDQDVAEWLPEQGRCRYVREWVAVKTRWHLRVDRTEKRRLTALAGDCANSVLRVRAAAVRRR